MLRNGYAMKWQDTGAFKVKADMMHYSHKERFELSEV